MANNKKRVTKLLHEVHPSNGDIAWETVESLNSELNLLIETLGATANKVKSDMTEILSQSRYKHELKCKHLSLDTSAPCFACVGHQTRP